MEIKGIWSEAVSSVPHPESLYSAFAGQSGLFRHVLEFCKTGISYPFGQLLLGIPAAWALGRYSFRGRRALVYLYMILMILPFQVTMVSSYGVLSFFHMLDTHWAVIFPGVFSALPVFLMTKFFQGIPDSLLEAAKVDGAGEVGAFFYVGLPLGLRGSFLP